MFGVDDAVGAFGSVASGALNFGFGQASAALNSRRSWKYYKKQKALDYEYDANQYFNLNRRYAENTARWQTAGLRAAGLNPILAATSGSFSNAPTVSGSTAGQVDTSAGHTPQIDINEGMRDAASAKQAKSAAQLADVEADNAGKVIDAELDIKRAQAEQIRANTDKLKADTTSAKGSINNLVGSVRSGLDSLTNNSAKQSDSNSPKMSAVFSKDDDGNYYFDSTLKRAVMSLPFSQREEAMETMQLWKRKHPGFSDAEYDRALKHIINYYKD